MPSHAPEAVRGRHEPTCSRRPPVTAPVAVSPLFKLFLGINLGLCVACLAVMVWLTAIDQESARLYSTCETVFKMTAGAFLGLLAGKDTSPDKAEHVLQQ